MSTRKVVAVLFATRGGMGDVGKMIAAHKENLETENNVELRFFALRQASKEGTDKTLTVDVVYGGGEPKKEIDIKLASMTDSITFVDLDKNQETAQALREGLSGVDSVVACLGNRQPSMSRWANSAAEQVVAAMKEKQVNRLVCLSSMGIGEDYVPSGGIRRFWGCLLSTVLRSVRKDLSKMEKTVQTSGLDYLLVRPVGLDPGRDPRGTWAILKERGSNKDVDILVSKVDTGKFMVQEAANPTLKKTAVTIAHQGKPPSLFGALFG